MRTALIAVLLALLPPSAADASWRHYPAKHASRGGVVLVVHGGSWRSVGPAAQRTTAAAARAYAARGHDTYNLDYRAGGASLLDVVRDYDLIRARTHASRICAYGESAGGQLALMLATLRSLRCVVSAAGPTDLASLPQPTRDAALAAFPDLALDSPVTHAASLGATRILQITARNDQSVPPAQARELKRLLPTSSLIALSSGSTPWIHSEVDDGELAAAAERALAWMDEPGG